MTRLVIESPHSEQTVCHALKRAAFHLNKEGYSGSDREQAAIVLFVAENVIEHHVPCIHTHDLFDNGIPPVTDSKSFKDTLPTHAKPTEEEVRSIIFAAVQWAEGHGFMVTVERKPLKPLSMKNDIAAINVWERK